MSSRTARRLVFLLVYVLSSIAAGAGFCDSLSKGPYLMLAAKPGVSAMVTDNTAMTIRWESDGNALSGIACRLEWGETAAYGSSTMVKEERPRWFSHTLRGLTPGATTHYRLTCKTDQYTGAFRLPPADAAAAVTFYAYGDTRGDNDVPSRQKYVLKQMQRDIEGDAARPYTLCLHTGDFVQRGQVKEEWDRDDAGNDSQFFIRENPSMWFLAHLPVAGVLGNHEGYKKRGTDVADFGQNFRNYWPYPFYPADRNAFYYSFDYGPVHFTVIDGNDRVDSCRRTSNSCQETGLNATVAGLKPGTTQYDWLAADLDANKPWKVVAIHNPLYAATAARDRFRDAPDLVAHLHGLFKEKGVKLVLQGHNHYYSRRVADGITYLTLGGGGAPLSGDTSDSSKRIFHFGRFDVEGKNLIYRIIDSSGNVADTNRTTLITIP